MLRVLGTRIGRIFVALAAVLLLAIALWVYTIDWHPSIKIYPLQGIDVSQAQGEIAWNTVAARGADFAYIRATAGGARDARFDANWDGAKAADLRRGAIHVWSFCENGVAQADNFVTIVPRTSDALPALLELSFTPGCDARPDRQQLVDQLKRFLTIAETHTGKPMLIKISRPVERAYSISAAIPRPLWEVRNFLKPDYATRPWRMWQASDMRRIDGISGPVNWDVVTP